MKIILPVAGKGTRLRPLTHTKAKSLIHIAGKVILGHIMDNLIKLNPDEFIFIVDQNGEQIKDYIDKNYKIKASYVPQEKRLGPAHAVWLAKPYIKEGDDILIVFNDTMFITDLTKINEICKDYDGLIYSKEVEDYQRFGVIVIENEKITKLVEKPNEPISKLAQVGLYYIKDGLNFLNIIEHIIKNKMTVKGEYYLPTVFQMMIDKGMKLAAPEIEEWLDCGKPETLFQTNKYLLEHGAYKKEKDWENSVIIQPVFIGDNAMIKNSVIGPYVSIAPNTKIENSIVKDSIIDESAIIKDASLNQSLIGSNVCVNGATKRLNIGDHSEIFFD